MAVFGRWSGVLASLAIGCGTTATISRQNGPNVEAKIVGGTPSSIIVESERGRYSLPRNDVREIDHPGNVHALIGGILAGYGVFNIAVGLPECSDGQFSSEAEHTGYCIGVFTPLVLGGFMVLWGMITHSNSVSAAKDTSSADAPPIPPERAPGVPPYGPPGYPPPAAPGGYVVPQPAPTTSAPPPPAPTLPPAPPPPFTEGDAGASSP